jgi:hypothetical protein
MRGSWSLPSILASAAWGRRTFTGAFTVADVHIRSDTSGKLTRDLFRFCCPLVDSDTRGHVVQFGADSTWRVARALDDAAMQVGPVYRVAVVSSYAAY